MNTLTSNQVRLLLLYGLKQFDMPADEAAAIAAYLNESNQRLMIEYLASTPKAEFQEIMNHFGMLLEEQEKT